MSATGQKKDKKRVRSGGHSGDTPDDKLKKTLTDADYDSEKHESDNDMDLEGNSDGDMNPGLCIALKRLQKELSGEIQDVIKSVDFLSNTVNGLRQELKQTKEALRKAKEEETMRMKQLEEEVSFLKLQNKFLNRKAESLENYSRKDNLLISGIKETEREDCRAITKAFLKDTLKISKNADIQGDPGIEIARCHRVGRFEPGKSRPLLVSFCHYEDKETVLRQRRHLKDTQYFMNDDLCLESTRRRDSLIPLLKELKKVDPKAHMRGEKLFSKGKFYTIENAHSLPIDLHAASTKSSNGVTAFSGRFSRLSNLHPCDIIVNGRRFSSVEQVYQYEKAIVGQRKDIADRIRQTDDPVEAMYLGKGIEVKQDTWTDRKEQIMDIALEAKFSLPQFKFALRQAEGIIGEATKDQFWGTGLRLKDPSTLNKDRWTGKNKMGEKLMAIKKRLTS